MSIRLREHSIHAIVLDIEGTTTPIAFVYGVLFPFARRHLREYLAEHAADEGMREAIGLLRDEYHRDMALDLKPPVWRNETPESIAAYVEWLMDRDRKAPGLKLLQGLIWREGFQSGALGGQVFADVPRALERWRQAGIDVAIYSSGSVLAQRLLFGTTAEGDLTRFISAFFDTATGAKTSADSYRRIADALHVATDHMLFVSDASAELHAARSVGCQVLLCVRPGNRVESDVDAAAIHSFDEIEP